MALISVDRKPTILGTKNAQIIKWRDGPGSTPYSWQVFRSGDFTSQGGGTLTGTTLRFHTITFNNNGPVAVQMVMDTSTSATATTADYSFSTGLSLDVGETLTLDVSTLGGATGIRRVLLVNNITSGDTSVTTAPPLATYTTSFVDMQVGFYTPHQSA
jgi:hypothetical protein